MIATTPPAMLDIEAVRRAFPALREVVYLNTGTYGLMPEPALAALLEATRALERYGVACPLDLGGIGEETRRKAAALLHAAPEEIAFTRNSTDGLNLALAGMEWREGDEVITTDEEHEALLHPLLYLQARRGIRMRCVGVATEPAAMIERVEAAISSRTRLLAFSHVSCETGARLPAAELCAWAAARGIRSLLDATQSVGVFPVDAAALGCDYLTTNGHKWLSGPTGTGLFFARRDRVEELSPAHVGAGSLERADAGAGIAAPWPTAARFEFGTRSWALPAGLRAALEWLDGLGWERVERHMAELSGYLKEGLTARPFLRLLTPRAWEQSSALTAFVFEDRDAGKVGERLREQAIHARHVPHYNATRLSTAHYNSREDVDRLLAALDAMAREG